MSSPAIPVLELLGLARSLKMYYGDPFQIGRMARFYTQFIGPGDLCFDVGAHVGSRVAAWRRLRARIVAVEPLPRLAGLLRRLYGRAPNVEVLEQALGAAVGEQELLICERALTISTLSPAWVAQLQRARSSFARERWGRAIVVPVTTLDALIERYGEPVFCKIDVEGYDLEVLRGLSRPLRALSFECVPGATDLALRCLERLTELGPYEFNWSPGESMRFELPGWVGAAELARRLQALPVESNPGDVYARLAADEPRAAGPT